MCASELRLEHDVAADPPDSASIPNFVILGETSPWESRRSGRQSQRSKLSDGRRLVRRKRFYEAQKQLAGVLEVDPSEPLARALMGRCIAEINPGSAEALVLCIGAVAVKRSPEILYQLGRVYLLANDRRRAVESFDEALELDSRFAQIHAEYAQIGARKPPVLRFLPRSHALNIRLGRLLKRMNLR